MHDSPTDPLLLARFLFRHAVVGFALAALFVGALMLVNLGNLRDLILASDVGWLAIFILTMFLGLTFASGQMAFAVMFASRRDDDGHGGSAVPVLCAARTD